MRTKTFLLAATAIVSTMVPVSLAFAQTDDSQKIEEIIVTARKRTESLLNVPVIEAVVTQKQIQRFQLLDLADVVSQVPGLNISLATNSVGTQVSLRGIGTNTLDAGIDQSVALNIDGMQISQGLAYSAAMFDIGQIEVLKGPQALFYGKNSPGGIISIRSADPTDETEVMLQGGYEFEANEYRGEAIVSGPITDTLLGRMAVEWDHSNGYFKESGVDNPAYGGLTPPNSHGPVDENYIARSTFIWNPESDLTFRLKLSATHDVAQEYGEQEVVSCPGGTGVGPAGVPFLVNPCGISRNIYQPDLLPSAFNQGGPASNRWGGVADGGVPTQHLDQFINTLETNYQVTPDITLTSDTGFYYVKYFGVLASPFGTGPAGPEIALNNSYNHRDVTEEVRANSNYSGPLNFTAGLFFQNAAITDQGEIMFNQDEPSIGVPLTWNVQYMKVRTYSAYAQVRYDITSDLNLAVGARYTDEQRSDIAYETFSANPAFFGGQPGPINPYSGPYVLPKLKADNLSPEGTLTYKPTDDITAYASIKKGFKSGSYDITQAPLPPPDLPYHDEKAYGGEMGVKSRWFDDTLAANLAVYAYRYDGLQVGATENSGGGIPVVETFNAASALIHGVDFDTSWKPPVDGLELHGSLEWNRAHFHSFNNAPCWGGETYAEGCNVFYNPKQNLIFGTASSYYPGYAAQNLAGTPLLHAPEWQLQGGFSYTFPVWNDMSMLIASETQYTSRYLILLGTRPDFWQPGYFKTDLNLTLRGPDDRWEIALIGKNLNDQLVRGSCDSYNNINGILGGQYNGLGGPGTMPGTNGIPSNVPIHGPSGVDSVACNIDRGRELWIRLTYRPFD